MSSNTECTDLTRYSTETLETHLQETRNLYMHAPQWRAYLHQVEQKYIRELAQRPEWLHRTTWREVEWYPHPGNRIRVVEENKHGETRTLIKD